MKILLLSLLILNQPSLALACPETFKMILDVTATAFGSPYITCQDAAVNACTTHGTPTATSLAEAQTECASHCSKESCSPMLVAQGDARGCKVTGTETGDPYCSSTASGQRIYQCVCMILM